MSDLRHMFYGWMFIVPICVTAAMAAPRPSSSSTDFSRQFPWTTHIDAPPLRQAIALDNTLNSNHVDSAPRTPLRHKPAVDFNDLSGWHLLLHGNMRATARRTREMLLGDDHSLRIDFVSGGYDKSGKCEGYLELAPPRPIQLDRPFDTATLWYRWEMKTNQTRYIRDGRSARVGLILRDRKGDLYQLPLGSTVGYKSFLPQTWGMLNASVHIQPWKSAPQNQLPRGIPFQLESGASYRAYGKFSPMEFPVRLESIAIFPPRVYGSAAGVECLYLDSLSCYESPQKAYPPKDTTPLKRVGTRGIVPVPQTPCETKMQRNGQTTLFTSRGADGIIEYRYTPIHGDLSDLTLRRNGGKWVTPFAGGGLSLCPGNDNARISAPPYGRQVTARLRNLTATGNALTADWQYTVAGVNIDVRYRFQLLDKSLTITIDEPTGKILQLDFGHPTFDGAIRKVDVPYLAFSCCETRHGNQPYAVLLDNKTFMFTMLDWTVSDASAPYGAYWDQNPARMNGGCVYLRLSDGRRNPFHERIVLTASDKYLEVLPDLPNPAGQRELASQQFFMVCGVMPYYPLRVMHDFGVENILYFTFSHVWVGPNESGFFRDEMKPAIEPELPKWLSFLKNLGYRHGGYCDYLAISPSSKYFRDDAIARDQDRSFLPDVGKSYRPKIPYALDVFKKVEPSMRDRYQLAGYYFDTYSAFGDMHLVDLDANAWGAGKFRTGTEAISKMMDLTKKSHSISFSEGKRTYEYAGYVDADYGTLSGWDPAKYPMLPAFCLYKIHPRTSMFGGFGWGPRSKTPPQNGYDQRRAFLIAYGMGDLQIEMPGNGYAHAPNTFSGFLRDYYIFRAYQRSCMPADVARIEYFNKSGDVFDTSDAIRQNLVKLGRLHVAYNNGLQVYVNYSADQDWTVAHGNQTYQLPPYGFVFAQGDDLLGFAAMRDGKKLEYVRCPDYIYFNTHGRPVTIDGVTADGQVLIRRDGKEVLTVIPTGGFSGRLPTEPSPEFKSQLPHRGCRMVRFSPQTLGADFTADHATAMAFDDQGKPIGKFAIAREGDWIELQPADAPQRYRIQAASEK